MKILTKVLGLLALVFAIITFLLPYRGSETLNGCFTMGLEGFNVLFFEIFIIIGILMGAIGWLSSKKYLLFGAFIFILLGHLSIMNLISANSNCSNEKDFFYYLYSWSGYIASFLFLVSALVSLKIEKKKL